MAPISTVNKNHVMTCIPHKTIVLMAISMLMIPTAVAYAGQEHETTQIDNTVGPVGNTDIKHNATGTDADPVLTQEQIDIRVGELIDKIGDLFLENHLLSAAISDELVLKNNTLDKIAQNNQTMKILKAELDILRPVLPDIYIPEEDMMRLKDAEHALFESDLPWYQLYINRHTATLDVVVDVDLAFPGVEEQIKKYTKDAPVVITYAKNTFQFQSVCDIVTEYCDPIVGGVIGEEKDYGLDCTISLAAFRTGWWGQTESGVIIPDHCNRQGTTYYQPSNDNDKYKIGAQSKDGGWYCDCDFIKSDSRSIDATKIRTGSSEITLNGRADLRKGDMVAMYGTTSGYDSGMIVQANIMMKFGNHVFSHLYKISEIDFTSGDSGAPIIGVANTTYGGMNIGADDDYNYGHLWTFLKDRLDLK